MKPPLLSSVLPLVMILFVNSIMISLMISLSSCDFMKKSGPNIARISLESKITSLDPANAYDLVSGNIVYQIYETLYEYHYLKRPYTIQPLLAEALPIIEDKGKKYIIKIKKNVLYHNNACFKGEKRFLKAQDFVTEFKRLAFAPTNSNGMWSFSGVVKGLKEFRELAKNDFDLFKKLNIEGIKTPDDYTLVIELTEALPQFTFLLAMSHAAPIPLEAFDCYRNDFQDQDLGTGPFFIKELNKEGMIKLERFKDYRNEYYPTTGDRWSHDHDLLRDAGKKIPFLDGIEFSYTKDFKSRWDLFIDKKIDIIDNIPKDQINTYITPSGDLGPELINKHINFMVSPSLIYWWLAFNMNDPIVGKNKNLRYAIAYAIDIDKLIKLFTHNIGQRANSIYPPSIVGYDPRKQLNFTYNLDVAKKYLKLAGAGHDYNEKKPPLTITFDTRGNDTKNILQAEFIKAELKKIGIEVNIQLNSFSEFLEKARKGKLQFWQGGWALDFPDPINVLQLLSSKNFPPGPNNYFYNNKKFEELFNKASKMENDQEKFILLRDIENIVLEDLPWIMTYYDRRYVLYNHTLKNYRHSDLVYNYLKYVKIAY
ncbi:MAG: hypothetical protein HQK49_17780 [Oligoflexia bacterium]|nr:hypothetical protein [Oligoflexia bacterium]